MKYLLSILLLLSLVYGAIALPPSGHLHERVTGRASPRNSPHDKPAHQKAHITKCVHNLMHEKDHHAYIHKLDSLHNYLDEIGRTSISTIDTSDKFIESMYNQLQNRRHIDSQQLSFAEVKRMSEEFSNLDFQILAFKKQNEAAQYRSMMKDFMKLDKLTRDRIVNIANYDFEAKAWQIQHFGKHPLISYAVRDIVFAAERVNDPSLTKMEKLKLSYRILTKFKEIPNELTELLASHPSIDLKQIYWSAQATCSNFFLMAIEKALNVQDRATYLTLYSKVLRDQQQMKQEWKVSADPTRNNRMHTISINRDLIQVAGKLHELTDKMSEFSIESKQYTYWNNYNGLQQLLERMAGIEKYHPEDSGRLIFKHSQLKTLTMPDSEGFPRTMKDKEGINFLKVFIQNARIYSKTSNSLQRSVSQSILYSLWMKAKPDLLGKLTALTGPSINKFIQNLKNSPQSLQHFNLFSKVIDYECGLRNKGATFTQRIDLMNNYKSILTSFDSKISTVVQMLFEQKGGKHQKQARIQQIDAFLSSQDVKDGLQFLDGLKSVGQTIDKKTRKKLISQQMELSQEVYKHIYQGEYVMDLAAKYRITVAAATLQIQGQKEAKRYLFHQQKLTKAERSGLSQFIVKLKSGKIDLSKWVDISKLVPRLQKLADKTLVPKQVKREIQDCMYIKQQMNDWIAELVSRETKEQQNFSGLSYLIDKMSDNMHILTEKDTKTFSLMTLIISYMKNIPIDLKIKILSSIYFSSLIDMCMDCQREQSVQELIHKGRIIEGLIKQKADKSLSSAKYDLSTLKSIQMAYKEIKEQPISPEEKGPTKKYIASKNARLLQSFIEKTKDSKLGSDLLKNYQIDPNYQKTIVDVMQKQNVPQASAFGRAKQTIVSVFSMIDLTLSAIDNQKKQPDASNNQVIKSLSVLGLNRRRNIQNMLGIQDLLFLAIQGQQLRRQVPLTKPDRAAIMKAKQLIQKISTTDQIVFSLLTAVTKQQFLGIEIANLATSLPKGLIFSESTLQYLENIQKQLREDVKDMPYVRSRLLLKIHHQLVASIYQKSCPLQQHVIVSILPPTERILVASATGIEYESELVLDKDDNRSLPPFKMDQQQQQRFKMIQNILIDKDIQPDQLVQTSDCRDRALQVYCYSQMIAQKYDVKLIISRILEQLLRGVG